MAGKDPKKVEDLLFASFLNQNKKKSKNTDDMGSKQESITDLFGLNISPVLFFIILSLFGIGIFWLFMILFNGFVMGLLGFAGGAFGYSYVVGLKKKQKETQFTYQLPDTLTAIANSLKAGFSLDQAFEFVTVSMPDPTKSEFSLIHLKYRVGYTLAESLAELPKKFDNTEVNLFVSSLVLQNQVGGNVIPFLGELSEILRQRVKLKEQIVVGTTQQRLSSTIVALLPYIMLMILQLSNYNSMTTTLKGILLLIFAIILQSIGLFISSITTKIDI